MINDLPMNLTIHRNPLTRLGQVARAALETPPGDPQAARVDEVDAHGNVIAACLPHQLDAAGTQLEFWAAADATTAAQRHFRVRMDGMGAPAAPMVTVSEEVYQGQDSYRIHTPNATWYFHRHGGGLAGLIDADGSDWISHRPHGGSDGAYRGIPNIKNPEDYFHPSAINAQSRLVASGALSCQVHVQTLDGVCEALWNFYPHCAQFTLLKAPPQYWLLYEGTPAGALDETNDYMVRSDGTQTSAAESWDAVLDPGWIYFGSNTARRVLFLAQTETEAKNSSYWPMQHNMTVFGFGRAGMQHTLEALPARYVFGLLDAADYETLRGQIDALRAA